VAFAESTEEVQEIVRACAEHRVPVIPSAPAPRWRGMSMRRAAASRSTLTQMNRILEVNAEDLDCTVEPA
jgi:D-lactate dehydrogenase (cytochrome)